MLSLRYFVGRYGQPSSMWDKFGCNKNARDGLDEALNEYVTLPGMEGISSYGAKILIHIYAVVRCFVSHLKSVFMSCAIISI